MIRGSGAWLANGGGIRPSQTRQSWKGNDFHGTRGAGPREPIGPKSRKRAAQYTEWRGGGAKADLGGGGDRKPGGPTGGRSPGKKPSRPEFFTWKLGPTKIAACLPAAGPPPPSPLQTGPIVKPRSSAKASCAVGEPAHRFGVTVVEQATFCPLVEGRRDGQIRIRGRPRPASSSFAGRTHSRTDRRVDLLFSPHCSEVAGAGEGKQKERVGRSRSDGTKDRGVTPLKSRAGVSGRPWAGHCPTGTHTARLECGGQEGTRRLLFSWGLGLIHALVAGIHADPRRGREPRKAGRGPRTLV